MKRIKSCLITCLGVLALLATPAFSQVYTQEFSNDVDGVGDDFEPNTRDPINEPDLGGLPPLTFNDLRNTWVGVIEENMSLVGDTAYPSPDPGADTPEYAVVQAEGGNGPFWSGLQAGYPNGQYDTIQYRVDTYADPVIAPDNNGIPEFWWSNAVYDAINGNYLTESGLTAFAEPDNLTWTYKTLGGTPIATVPVGLWYQMQTTYVTTGPLIHAIQSLYDATGTVLLGSVTETNLFLNPASADMGRPGYSWFTYFDQNVDVIFIDDFGVAAVPVPEPASIALLGAGALGLIVAARRRRRA